MRIVAVFRARQTRQLITIILSLSKDQPTPEMKVVYMSGYTDHAIVHHEVLGEGMNYVQKPFTMDGLVRKVREVLDQ